MGSYKLFAVVLLIMLSGCVTKKKCANRFPPLTGQEVKEKTEIKDSVFYYQTEIKIAPLGSVIKVDSIVCRESNPILIPKSNTSNQDIRIESEIKNGILYTKFLQEDSLKVIIDSLQGKITTITTSRSEKNTVVVEKEVPKKYIPKWVWYLIGLNVIQLVFRTRKIWIKLINPLS